MESFLETCPDIRENNNKRLLSTGPMAFPPSDFNEYFYFLATQTSADGLHSTLCIFQRLTPVQTPVTI